MMLLFVIITYDVNVTSENGAKCLRKIAKECVNYGHRVQNSVFEVNIDYGQFIMLKDRLSKLMDHKKDSIRFYYLGNKWRNKVEHLGINDGYDSDGVLIY